MGKLPLSVAIITYNEEDRIGRTLDSVKDIASEIVVVDSHSTDRTREIAQSYGAKVYVEDWKGHANQKNSALKKCSYEWILFLDADEVVSQELRRSIEEELRNPKADGYLINRRTYYMGRFLRYTWQPEWRLRLVRRSSNPRWKAGLHEQLTIESGRLSKLRGDLYHYSYRNLMDHVSKMAKYAKELALEKGVGSRVTLTHLLLRPVWAFFKMYFLRRGFLDGYPGFIASMMSMFYTFLKYAFLYELKLKGKDENT